MVLTNNKDPITASQNLSALSGFKGSITEQVKTSADLTRVFFQMPYDQSNGIVQPLLCYAADHFRKNTNSPENLSAALKIFLTFYSVRLGYPLSIIIQSDDTEAVHHLLDICKQIAPKGSFIEFQELTWEQLYENQDKFRGKMIICTSPKGCKKALPDIQNLIVHGRSARQVSYKSSMGKYFEQRHIKYPVGFIGVETTDEKNVLDHPAILKISLSSDAGPESYAVMGYNNFQQPTEEHSREAYKIKKIFERLPPCEVQLPFNNQISLDFMRQQPTDFVFKFSIAQKVLSLLTIMDSPSLITPDELMDGFIGLNSSKNRSIAAIKIITATKVEYAIMALLLKGIIPIMDDHHPRILIIVFEAVKKINYDKLKNSIVDSKDDIKVLSALYKGNSYWAKPIEIFEKANSKGGKRISIQVIKNQLNRLKRLGIIAEKKFPQESDHGYYINDTSIGKHITFQKPSEINDPKFNMAPVKVVNPITGKIETI